MGNAMTGVHLCVVSMEAPFSDGGFSGILIMKVVPLSLPVFRSMVPSCSSIIFFVIMSPNPVLVDVRGFYNAAEIRQAGFHYKTL